MEQNLKLKFWQNSTTQFLIKRTISDKKVFCSEQLDTSTTHEMYWRQPFAISKFFCFFWSHSEVWVVTIWVLSQFQFYHHLVLSQFELSQFEFWVLLQFKFCHKLSFITIWILSKFEFCPNFSCHNLSCQKGSKMLLSLGQIHIQTISALNILKFCFGR